MHLHAANIANLTSLWKKYGARRVNGGSGSSLYINESWPDRCWFDRGVTSETDVEMLLVTAPDSAVVPVWPTISVSGCGEPPLGRYEQLLEHRLTAGNRVCGFEQAAMYLDLKDAPGSQPPANSGFTVRPVNASDELKAWVDISSEAFGYCIDHAVIESLRNDAAIQLLLGSQDGEPVASALINKTGEVIGVHQLGVKLVFQGQGIARRFMQEIIAACGRWQGRYLVLQASEAGRPLYDRLGFSTQFAIRNFVKGV